MDQSAYDGILDRLDEVTGGRRPYGLVGCSTSLEGFVATIAALSVELREAPDSSPGSAPSPEKRPRSGRANAAGAKGSPGPRDSPRAGRRPLGVIIGRSVADDSVDNSLLDLCGRDASWSEMRLAPNADTYNSVQLFGLGTRPGPFESPTGPVVVVRGLEHLSEAGRRRFSRHLQAWCRDHPDAGLRLVHVVMLVETGGGPPSLVRSLVEELGGVLDCHSIAMPPLSSRPEDVPFVLHGLARGHGGHLRDFQRDGLGRIVAYPWPGDLAELKVVVRRLYGAGPGFGVEAFRATADSRGHRPGQDGGEAPGRHRRFPKSLGADTPALRGVRQAKRGPYGDAFICCRHHGGCPGPLVIDLARARIRAAGLMGVHEVHRRS